MSQIDVERVADSVEAAVHSLDADTTREPRVVRGAG
jgi:hypothetical protein